MHELVTKKKSRKAKFKPQPRVRRNLSVHAVRKRSNEIQRKKRRNPSMQLNKPEQMRKTRQPMRLIRMQINYPVQLSSSKDIVPRSCPTSITIIHLKTSSQYNRLRSTSAQSSNICIQPAPIRAMFSASMLSPMSHPIGMTPRKLLLLPKAPD